MENSPFAHHFPRETMDFRISKSSYPWVYPPQILPWPFPIFPPRATWFLLVNDLQVRIEAMGLIFFGPQESQESVGCFLVTYWIHMDFKFQSMLEFNLCITNSQLAMHNPSHSVRGDEAGKFHASGSVAWSWRTVTTAATATTESEVWDSETGLRGRDCRLVPLKDIWLVVTGTWWLIIMVNISG